MKNNKKMKMCMVTLLLAVAHRVQGRVTPNYIFQKVLHIACCLHLNCIMIRVISELIRRIDEGRSKSGGNEKRGKVTNFQLTSNTVEYQHSTLRPEVCSCWTYIFSLVKLVNCPNFQYWTSRSVFSGTLKFTNNLDGQIYMFVTELLT